MFVRFRTGRRRLALSLVETKRLNGKVRHKHIATLGSVETPLTIRSRIAFWAKLNGRLAALGNRLGPEDQSKIMDAIHARVPIRTLDEQREIQTENAKDDEQFWGAMEDMNAASAEGHKTLIASAEKKRAAFEQGAADAAEKREIARERLAKLAWGESVAGGLGKTIDVEKFLRERGWTTGDIKHARLLAAVAEALGDDVISRMTKWQVDAGERASRRTLRQMAKLLAIK